MTLLTAHHNLLRFLDQGGCFGFQLFIQPPAKEMVNSIKLCRQDQTVQSELVRLSVDRIKLCSLNLGGRVSTGSNCAV